MIYNSKRIKSKGFTLVELLVVIVILAILVLLAIPQVLKIYNNSKLKAFESEAKVLARDAYSYYMFQNPTMQQYQDTINCSEVKAIEAEYASCTLEYNSGNPIVTVVGTGKYNGMMCTGTKDDMNCKLTDEEIITKTYVTFDANGGNFDGNPTLRVGYQEVNSEYKADKTYKHPSRDSHIFLGWYKDKSYHYRFKLNDYNIPENVEDITVYAKWENVENVFTYTTNDNKVTITGFNDTGLSLYNNDQLTILQFPSKINGKDVVAINPVSNNKKFRDKVKITEIIIPDTITNMPQYTFYEITNLSKLTIPISFNAGNWIFNSTKLTNLNFTKGKNGKGYDYNTTYYLNTPWYMSRTYGNPTTASIGNKPLVVNLDDGITRIGNNTFRNSMRVTGINGLYENVEEIGDYTFYQAGNPLINPNTNKIKKIGTYAFAYTLAPKINIDSSVESIGSYAFAYSKINGTFLARGNVKTWGTYVLSNTNITELIIDNTITSFPQYTFYNMSNLKKLTIPININAGNWLFNSSKLEELKLTKGTTGAGYDYNTTYYLNTPWYTSRELGGASASSIGSTPLKVTLGVGVNSIGKYTFYNSYRVHLQSSISGITIGSNAFTNSGANIN